MACPCCGYYTLSDDFEICAICWWEHDFVQESKPDSRIGANGESLREAQRNFAAFGASSAVFKQDVRPPAARHFRDPDFRPLDEGGQQDVLARDIIQGRRQPPRLLSCRCCGYYRNVAKEHDVCEICGWQHNVAQESDPDTEVGPNDVTLRAAQANFVQFGASSERVRGQVRPTSYGDLDPEWKRLV